jgi:hypothetical protein
MGKKFSVCAFQSDYIKQSLETDLTSSKRRLDRSEQESKLRLDRSEQESGSKAALALVVFSLGSASIVLCYELYRFSRPEPSTTRPSLRKRISIIFVLVKGVPENHPNILRYGCQMGEEEREASLSFPVH